VPPPNAAVAPPLNKALNDDAAGTFALRQVFMPVSSGNG
jgi:hypothetical protein